jgi:hypothetical protein
VFSGQPFVAKNVKDQLRYIVNSVEILKTYHNLFEDGLNIEPVRSFSNMPAELHKLSDHDPQKNLQH